MNEPQDFATQEAVRLAQGELVVDLDGFEGPIDALLVLARQQKIDLLNISILQLADQYVAFISEARQLRLEIAADYLVMAAWLAYLKSRLLLPEPEDDEEPSGPEMAEALAFQLRRLESMQQAGAAIMELPRLGRDVFARGAPEGMRVIRTPVYELTLYELLKAYGDQQRRSQAPALLIAPTDYYTVDDALERLSGLLGRMPDWQTLESFLPPDLRDPTMMRSAVAATFAATLELAKAGKLTLRQSGTFGPIYLRSSKE